MQALPAQLLHAILGCDDPRFRPLSARALVCRAWRAAVQPTLRAGNAQRLLAHAAAADIFRHELDRLMALGAFGTREEPTTRRSVRRLSLLNAIGDHSGTIASVIHAPMPKGYSAEILVSSNFDGETRIPGRFVRRERVLIAIPSTPSTGYLSVRVGDATFFDVSYRTGVLAALRALRV